MSGRSRQNGDADGQQLRIAATSGLGVELLERRASMQDIAQGARDRSQAEQRHIGDERSAQPFVMPYETAEAVVGAQDRCRTTLLEANFGGGDREFVEHLLTIIGGLGLRRNERLGNGAHRLAVMRSR